MGAERVIGREELLGKIERSVDSGKPLKVKWGADPSAPDLHLGHSVVLRALRRFQDMGHEVQFLIGDFTARIGDPTGKAATRPPLSREEVEANAKTYLAQAFRVLDESRTRVVRNSDWCRPLSFEDVLRLASKITVARILERDDFANRLKEGRPVSLHELLYPLIQGYDSVVLASDVELCGTDQIFNCLVGRALQQEEGQEPEVIVAMPLLEGLDGVRKMSKSLGNHVGLTEEPREMYAKVLRISDDLMWRWYALLSDDPRWGEKRDRVKSGALHPKVAKEELALEITARFHGQEAAREARNYFENRYAFSEKVDYPEAVLEAGDHRADDLLVRLGVAKTKGEAKRLVAQGALEWGVEGETRTKPASFQERLTLRRGEPVVVRCGRHFFRVRAG